MADVFTDITELLKTEYVDTGKLGLHISEKTVVLDLIKRNSGVTNMSQKSFEVDCDAYGANAYWFDPDTDSDLSSHAPTFDSMTVSVKSLAVNSFVKDIDLQVKKAGATADIAIKLKNHLVLAMARAMNVSAVADTKGKIARANGANAAAVVTFDEAVPDAFKPGQLITIGSNDATVSTVDSETQITLTTTVSVTDNDIIYDRSASTNAADGLGNLIANTGTIQGVNKATNYWAHSFIDSTSEAIDTADLLKIALKVNRYGTGAKVILTGEDLWRKIGADLTSLKQVNLASAQSYIDLPGGWSGLRFAAGAQAMPIIQEADMVYGTNGKVYVITPEALTLGSLGERFLPGSNGFFDRVNKRPKWEITMVNYANFAVKNFKAVGLLSNKTT